MTALAVRVAQLGQVVWVSLLAGIFATTAFSLVVLGGSRSAEARRAGRSAAALAYAGLAAVALAAVAGLVVFGVQVMLTKS